MTGIEVALIATAIGGVVSAAGSFAAAQGQAAGKDYEAAVADRNARIARGQASADSADARRETRRRLAAIRATFGSNGFSLDGSALDVLEDQAHEGELAAQRETYAGEIRALGHEDQASLARYEKRSLKRSASIGLVGGLIGTAGSTASTGVKLGVF